MNGIIFYYCISSKFGDSIEEREGLVCAIDYSHAESILRELFLGLIDIIELEPFEMEVGSIMVWNNWEYNE